jgi:hypothetical protein
LISGRERHSLIKTNAGVRASLDAAIKGVRHTTARKHLTSSKVEHCHAEVLPAVIQVFSQFFNVFFIEEGLRNKLKERNVAAGTTATVHMPNVNEVLQGRHVVASFVRLDKNVRESRRGGGGGD